jgi:hypothetical protein
VPSLFPSATSLIANFIIFPAACLALASCSQQSAAPLQAKPEPAASSAAPERVMPDPGAVYNRLSNYADDLSSVSKRAETKVLPTTWNGMMELALAEMQGRQWDQAKTHLSLATKMAPNAASLVLTRGQFAMLEAKRGRYNDAITYLDALRESPEVASNNDMVGAVETMRATINQYRLSGRRMP